MIIPNYSLSFLWISYFFSELFLIFIILTGFYLFFFFLIIFLCFDHMFHVDCNQYTRDHKHERRANGLERRRRGSTFVATEGGLVRAQGDGAGRRIHTQEVTGRGSHRACSRQGGYIVCKWAAPRHSLQTIVPGIITRRSPRYLYNNQTRE